MPLVPLIRTSHDDWQHLLRKTAALLSPHCWRKTHWRDLCNITSSSLAFTVVSKLAFSCRYLSRAVSWFQEQGSLQIQYSFEELFKLLFKNPTINITIGQCKTQTADCRMQTGGRWWSEVKMQITDFLTESCHRFHHWKLSVNRLTRVIFSITRVIFRLTGE